MHKDDLRLQLDLMDIPEGIIYEFRPRMKMPISLDKFYHKWPRKRFRLDYKYYKNKIK